MGRAGAAPRPTALKLLHGDKPSRINLDEPEPRQLSPEPPAWLTGAAAEEWARVAPDLAAMGTARRVDSAALAAYCEAVARLQTAVAVIARTGLLLRDGGQLRKNPAVAQARDASYEVRMWAREFGFTPSARAGIRVEHIIHGDAARLLTHG